MFVTFFIIVSYIFLHKALWNTHRNIVSNILNTTHPKTLLTVHLLHVLLHYVPSTMPSMCELSAICKVVWNILNTTHPNILLTVHLLHVLLHYVPSTIPSMCELSAICKEVCNVWISLKNICCKVNYSLFRVYTCLRRSNLTMVNFVFYLVLKCKVYQRQHTWWNWKQRARRTKRPLLVYYIHCKCSMETSRNGVKSQIWL